MFTGDGSKTNLCPTIVSWKKELQIFWEGFVEKVLPLDERLAYGSVLELHEEKVAAHLMPVALQRHRAVFSQAL